MASPEEASELGAAPDRRVPANPDNHFAKDSILPVKLYCNYEKCVKYYGEGKGPIFLGSCFLIQELNEDKEYLYFATAAHNLYCTFCKNYRWVKPILEWEAGQSKAAKFLLGEPNRGVSEKGCYGWMKVPEKYKQITSDAKERYPFDYGILAVNIAGIDKATQYAANVRMFAAPDAHHAFVELAYLCGYPSAVCSTNVQGGRYWMPPDASLAGKEATDAEDPAVRKQEERRTAALYPMPQMHGEMPACPKQGSQWSKTSLYRHYIDSSSGQSGSPVYSLVKSNGGEQCMAMGIHVGLWRGEAGKEKSMGFNVAVRLHGHVLYEMKTWVANRSNEATGQSKPVQGADTLDGTEDGVLDCETLRQSATLFGSSKAEPVPGAPAQAHPPKAPQPRAANPWKSKEYLHNYQELLFKMEPDQVKDNCTKLGLMNPYFKQKIDAEREQHKKNEVILERLEAWRDRFGMFREILRLVGCEDIAAKLDLVGPDPATDAGCLNARKTLE